MVQALKDKAQEAKNLPSMITFLNKKLTQGAHIDKVRVEDVVDED